ncbi:retrovirus-related pol polyprotein from transposon TNT 1-94 [Tanacetum coccineum]
MLAKQNDPISKEKKINTTLINYAELNRLSRYFSKCFALQQELSDEQAFWLQTSHLNTDQSASSSVKIKAPRELPKVSLVNTSLKKLKYHLGKFDMVVKKRITPDALIEGEWGFEHNLMICVMNSTVVFDNVNVEMQSSESCVKCVDLDAELLNKQSVYNDLSKSCLQLKKHCTSLELTMQLNQEIFQKDSLSNNQNAFEILEYFENNDFKAQLQAKDTTIWKEVENAAQIPIATTVAPGMFKLDLDPLTLRLLQNRGAHTYYLKHTQEQANILQGIVKQAIAKQPLDNALDLASRDTNLYTISLDDMLKTSLICLLSKASKTKSCLWHRQLLHLNFGTLNKLAKDGLARGIPKLKFQKDHLCSACALGKSKKSSHQPKAEDTNQEKLYLLHMDLCGPMRVESLNGK